MAKKKMSSNQLGCEVGDYSPSTYLDFDDVKEVKGLAVGDVVRVVLKGTIRSIEQREKYEGAGTRSSICLKDFDAEIVTSSELDKLFADEEDD